MSCILFITVGLLQVSKSHVMAQEKKQIVRLARLVIDSIQLESYNAFLKEEIET